ncbi:uncharacterized protein PRCAT00006137001 [Priceomyces carsonii]|uniref:uncharacterized protein n=1 Tax=Priceomyces carsonii TaxID=28549 RepID=UPI002EDA3176|nr:unnamed protein product [Priceomyces carsonii]
MSTIQLLTTDLLNLSSESKRKSSEVRQSCDVALLKLKELPGLANAKDYLSDIDMKQKIVQPCLIACTSGNVKLATISIPILQKLIVTELIPVSSLGELMEALKEATHLAIDIQLKILQCLPALMQNYESDMRGDLLIELLGICTSLTANNKSTVVINTASATLQQLFGNIYDKLKTSKEKKGNNEIKIDSDEIVLVDDNSLEAFNIFKDLTRLIENDEVPYFKNEIHIRVLSVLEIIENILIIHYQIFRTHQELAYLLRVKVVPALLRILYSPDKNFALTTRAIRIIQVLLSTQLENLEIESELILSFLNHILIGNEANEEHSDQTNWEKMLVLEMFKNIFANFDIVKSIFEKFDSNPRKKNVVKELLSIFCNYIPRNAPTINEIIEFPPRFNPSPSQGQLLTPVVLSKSSSIMKSPLLDHLDKTEAPTLFPITYPIYCIFNILLEYADGTAKFVQGLSGDANPENIESEVEFINVFIETSFNEISSIYHTFLYLQMDNDCFHLLIRSLQKYTHTTGLLGASSLRDDLLTMLSAAIVKNSRDHDNRRPILMPNNHYAASSIQEQGKQLLAFGESIVESFSSNRPSTSSEGPSSQSTTDLISYSRYFNSRQVTCLRALINLAVSLGSTLQKSWRIIWLTLQWSDYYIKGPDQFSSSKVFKGLTGDMLPRITSQDESNIQVSEKKFFESVNKYPKRPFQDLLQSLIELSQDLLEESENSPNNNNLENLDEKYTRLCPYNKVFFLTKIQQICDINLLKFFIEYDEPWFLISDYFIRLGNNRSIQYNLRIHITKTYAQLINNLATIGFENSLEEINGKTSKKSLAALIGFLNRQLEIGAPDELLVLNCETEIHLLILDTLHDLVDKYDTFYQNSWNIVFQILNTPFRVKSKDTKDNNLSEKVRSLIESSFDTLKLILDEFLASIPANQLKLLIDTLFNFCKQTYDLNISFSSISYFWLFSDSLKLRINNTEEIAGELATLRSEKDLTQFIEKKVTNESRAFYLALDTYLLSTLLKLSDDNRAQVRDGSIQTFFQIIDVHGNILTPLWDLIYEAVLPSLLNLNLEINSPSFIKKEWIESLSLILSGLISIYSKFMMDLTDETCEKWDGLLKYFSKLLDLKWVDLNLKIFRSFNDLLKAFQLDHSNDYSGNKRIQELLFRFWNTVPVEYDFTNSLYQESITALIQCFPPLYLIIKRNITQKDINKIISILNRCARYPVLPGNQLDNTKPSKLQAAVLKDLKVIDDKDPQIQSQVVQLLNSIATYPFGVRERIEQKLTTVLQDKVRVPSFIAVSHLSVKLLRSKLALITDFKVMIEDKAINKILKSLLEIIKLKAIGIEKEPKPLWVEATDVLRYSVSKLIDENVSEIDSDELWTLILRGVTICFESNSPTYEAINLEQYSELSSVVLPAILDDSQNRKRYIEEFITSLYSNSTLYEYDVLELSLLEQNTSPENITHAFTSYDFNSFFGSTQPLVTYSNKSTRILCLKELIRYSVLPSDTILNTFSRAYFIARASMALRRYICDRALLFRCPVPKVQHQELLLILDGLLKIQNTSTEDKTFKKLQPLLTRLIPYASNFSNLDLLLEPLIDALCSA